MEYPLYNEHGIRIGMLTTSNPIPRNATIKISYFQEYFAITNTTEERLNELVEKNLEVLREEVEIGIVIPGKEHNSQSIPRETRTCNNCRTMNATDDKTMICGVSYGYLCEGCRAVYRLSFDTDEKFRESCYRRSDKKLEHYCMECEKMVAVIKVREGSETYDTMCSECRGDDLTRVSEEGYNKQKELDNE